LVAVAHVLEGKHSFQHVGKSFGEVQFAMDRTKKIKLKKSQSHVIRDHYISPVIIFRTENGDLKDRIIFNNNSLSEGLDLEVLEEKMIALSQDFNQSEAPSETTYRILEKVGIKIP